MKKGCLLLKREKLFFLNLATNHDIKIKPRVNRSTENPSYKLHF